jgi:hypothetical protein
MKGLRWFVASSWLDACRRHALLPFDRSRLFFTSAPAFRATTGDIHVLSAIALSTLLVSQSWDNSGAAASREVPPVNSSAYQQPVGPQQIPVAPAAAALPSLPGGQFDPQVMPVMTQSQVAYFTEAASTESPIAEAASPGYVTRQELQAEVNKMAWRKGDFTVIPYGTIWGSMSYDSQRSKIGDYALWIESQDVHPNDPDFNVDAKSTRLGLDFTGPGIPCLGEAKIGGKVEVDFQGQFVTRNKPGLLLRHAYVEAKDDDFRLLVGQTWDVISPLAIPTLNYTAGSAVGNLGYRRAQFRAERYLAFSDDFLMALQGSVNGNVVTDFVSDPATTTSADPGPYPDIQGRVGLTLGDRSCPDSRPVVLGVGGHIGIQSFDFRTAPVALDDDVLTYSLATDFVVPLTERLGIQGEFFTGFNLSNYMGGILQGVDRVTHKGIHATGGWIDICFDWTPCLHTHSGFAIDDPLDSDMTSGRVRNQMIYNNVLWDATKNLQFGFEVDVWETHYIALAAGEGVRLEFATKYKF